MKKILQSLVVIVLAFTIISCSEDEVLPPGYFKPHGCLTLETGIALPYRNLHINSISPNKKWAVGYAGLDRIAQCIIDLEKNEYFTIFSFAKNNSMNLLQYMDSYTSSFPFCPYDGNKIFGGFYPTNPFDPSENIVPIDYWGIIDFDKKGVDTVQIFQNGILVSPEKLVWNNKIKTTFIRPIKWLSKSKPGDDYFYFDNNTILHLQSSTWSEGIPNLNVTKEDKVVSLSPDEKTAIVHRGNGEFSPITGYATINNNKVVVNENITSSSLYHSVFSWSPDSKKLIVLGTKIENNFLKPLFYVYEVDNNTNLLLKHTIDLTKIFCSYGGSHRANFLTDSTLVISLNPNNEEYGSLYEIRLDGSVIRKITKLREF